MYTLKEGEKRTVRGRIERKTGAGAIALTTPQRRILNTSRALITGFDWATAQWDATASEISALFDSTATGLTAPGTYYMQLRGVIGSELYAIEIKVVVQEWGP
jgi:hypothetical protein